MLRRAKSDVSLHPLVPMGELTAVIPKASEGDTCRIISELGTGDESVVSTRAGCCSDAQMCRLTLRLESLSELSQRTPHRYPGGLEGLVSIQLEILVGVNPASGAIEPTGSCSSGSAASPCQLPFTNTQRRHKKHYIHFHDPT